MTRMNISIKSCRLASVKEECRALDSVSGECGGSGPRNIGIVVPQRMLALVPHCSCGPRALLLVHLSQYLEASKHIMATHEKLRFSPAGTHSLAATTSAYRIDDRVFEQVGIWKSTSEH